MQKVNFNKGFKSGFTLLELLIVVAIIAILSAIVMVSSGGSKSKGADGGIKAQLVFARSQAEVVFNTRTANTNSYTNVCVNGLVDGVNGIGGYVLNAAKIAGLSVYATNAVGSATTATCNNSAGAYAAEVPLRSVGMWCIDWTGKSVATAGSTLSGATDYTCN